MLFIDEIHRLSRAVEEVLYPAMEDFQLDIVLGKGPAARSIRLDLPRFTLVGATTRTGLITGPLRDRFGLVARLDYYEPADLEAIVVRAAGILGVDIDADGAARSPAGPGARPASPTGCCAGCATSPRCAADGIVDRRRRGRRPVCRLRRRRAGLDKVDRAVLGAAVRALRRRPGRPQDAGHQRRRARRDRRGRLRAVPHPAGPAHAHAPGPRGHAGGLGPPRPGRAATVGPAAGPVRLT